MKLKTFQLWIARKQLIKCVWGEYPAKNAGEQPNADTDDSFLLMRTRDLKTGFEQLQTEKRISRLAVG